MFKQLMAVLLMCAAVLVSATQSVEATPSESRETRSENSAVSDTVGEVMSATRQAEVDAKRQAIEQKVAEKKQAITEKLSGKEVERCEQKEQIINSVLENRVIAAQRHFDNFEAIEAKLRAFVTDKNLDLTNAGVFESALIDANRDAQAAISTMEAVPFACEEASASAPGAIVKTQISGVKQALIDYRTAIKAYAEAAKGAVSKASEPTQESAQ